MDVDKHNNSEQDDTLIPSKLFSNIEDLEQCETIHNVLKTIYTHHPCNILQEIAEFATGIIQTCNNELCNDEVLLLNENNTEKSLFCQQCKPKLTRCWYEWDDRYDNTHQCQEIFVERNCECGGFVRFCSNHRSYCNQCGNVSCTNSYGAGWKYESWKCAKHHSVCCRSCKQRFCEAQNGGSWCIGCDYVCKSCVEYKCECKMVEEYAEDNDDEIWYKNCIKHRNCLSQHAKHLGFCDCSKECTSKLCCCQDTESMDIFQDKVICFKCLVCGETKKYDSNHLPTKRRFVCFGDNCGAHSCGHGICLDCEYEEDEQEYNLNTQCVECMEECDHSGDITNYQ